MAHFLINDTLVLNAYGNIGIGTLHPRSSIDVFGRTDGIIIPSTPYNIPSLFGSIRINTTVKRFEVVRNGTWEPLVPILEPTITSAVPTRLPSARMASVISGNHFEPIAEWSFVDKDGTLYPCVSDFLSTQQVVVYRPDYLPLSKSPYKVRVHDNVGFVHVSTFLFDIGSGPVFTSPSFLSNLDPDTYYFPGIPITAIDQDVDGGILSISINGDISTSGLLPIFDNQSTLFLQGATPNIDNIAIYNFTATAIDTGSNISTMGFSFLISNGEGFTGTSEDIIPVTRISGTTEVSLVNNYWRRYQIVWSYSSLEIHSALLYASRAIITGMRFMVRQQPLNQPYPDYAIGIKLHTLAVETNISGNVIGGEWSMVKSPSSESFTTNEAKIFNFTQPITWVIGNNIGLVCAWGQCPVNYSDTGTMDIGDGRCYFTSTDESGLFTIYDLVDSSRSRVIRPVVQFICL